MNASFRWAAAAAAALCLVGAAGAAGAQRSSTGLEIGIDAALTHTSFDVPGPGGSATEFDLPVQAIRLGFALSPTIWLEPELGLRTVSENGSFTTATFDVGLPISLSGPVAPSTTQYFVRPLLGFRHFSGSGSDAQTQTAFGVGIGMRVPIVDRLAGRFEGRYVRGLHSDNFPASDEFSLLAGLSFFTR
jgi:hypothetical protein